MNIQLNEKHRSQLQEMIETLYPEMSFKITTETDQEFSHVSEGMIESSIDRVITEYHWFEFLLTHLVKRIYTLDEMQESRELQDWLMAIVEGNVEQTWGHPVGWLYVRFKEYEESKTGN